MRLVFTQHAVERFVQRIAPDLTLLAARALLEQAETVRLREKTHAGELLFRSAEPPALFVVKPDGDFVCVTVLPDAPVETMGAVAEWEMELIREHMAEVAEREAAALLAAEAAKHAAEDAQVAQRLVASSTTRAVRAAARDHVNTTRAAARQANQTLDVVLQEHRRLRDREKTIRHKLSEDDTKRKLADALRIAMRVLTTTSSPEATAALAEISTINPGFLTEAFIYLRKGYQ